MKKESVKKFDLEAAFKALDEIEIPQTKGIKANRVDLKERFGHKSATETLVEDYYDVSSAEDLNDAKEERDGEIAKAKLARIEKIVDLNAESPEDLLPSYVGKVIMQCPQCMTLFYKNSEDIEPSEENPDIVNLNEPCQHCGNTSGYTLIGKVGAVTEDEVDKYDETSAEENENELNIDFGKGTEEVDAEGTGEGAKEMSDEETKEESSDEASSDDDLDLDLNLDEVPEEEPEEKKKEESLNLSKEASENESDHKSENLTLNEEVDKDLDEKLKAHNDYIAYLQQMIKQEEEALKKAENDEIKAAIQRRLDAFNADLEAALPDAVKAEVSVEDITEEPVESATDKDKTEEKLEKPALKESVESEIDSIIASWGVNENLIKEDKSLPLRSVEIKDKENSRKGIGWLVVYGGKYNLHKEFKNEEEAKKFAKENNGKLMPIRTAEVGSLKEYWWEDNDPMNWSDKEPLVYSCYYNSELLGYLEYPYMGQEEYPTTVKADIIKHFELPKDYNSKEISWRYIENEPLDETKPLVKVNESLTEEGNLDRLLDSDEFKTPVSEEEINAARREVAKESLKEEKEDEADEDEEADEEDESDDEESEAAEIEEPEFNEDDIDELDECSLNKHIDEYLKEVYSNVKSYKTTDCELKDGKLIVEGKISFKSGKEKLTMFEFLPAYRKGKLFFEGYNKDFSEDKAFTLNCSINKSKTLITESFGYKYKINKNLVKGLK